MRRSLSNKMSAPLHYQSSLASTGPVIITSAENVDYSLQPYSGVQQKNMVLEKLGGIQYAHSIHCSHEAKAANQPNQMSVSSNMPVQHSFISSAGQIQIGFVQNPVSVVPAANGAVVGTTELRNDSHAPNGPAQLTIFYAGSVSVYSNISPEKAQAIMFLAGNGTPNTSGPTLAASPPQGALLPRPSIIDGFAVNRDNIRTVCFPSPISITPYTVPQSATGSGSTKEATSVKLATLAPSVPLARKASLARFLEKRKERVIRASPYATKQSPKCDSPGSSSISYPVNSLSTCPLPAAN